MKKKKHRIKIFPIVLLLIGLNLISHAKCRLSIKDNTVVELKNGILEHREDVRFIEIPDGVKRIGAGAFLGCCNLEEVKLPDSVTYIGIRAFSDCIDLARIVLPDSVRKIRWGAFARCRG